MTAFPGLVPTWNLDAYLGFDGKWVGTAHLPRYGGYTYQAPVLSHIWTGVEATMLIAVGGDSREEARARVKCYVVMATQRTVGEA